MLLREEDDDEEIFEVCCQFLDERVPSGWVDGDGADHVDHEGEEKERKLDDKHCASRECERLRTDAEWDGDDFYDNARYVYDADDRGRA
jgi:hypothetical protein